MFVLFLGITIALILGGGFAFIFWTKKDNTKSRVPPKLNLATEQENPIEQANSHYELFDEEAIIKLKLARQYLDVRDWKMAQEILKQVMLIGNEEEKAEARKLFRTIPSQQPC